VRRLLLLNGVFLTILSGTPSQALNSQVTLSQLPNPITPQLPELPSLKLQQPLPSLIQPIPQQQAPGTRGVEPQIPGTIRISRFEFVGNTAFSDRQLAAATKPFIARDITFAELLTVETVITQKYVQAGYINSGAVIAANQTFPRTGGIVKVNVIEGGLEEIQILGTHHLNPDYVRSRIALATHVPLNRNRLLEALQLLQLDPQIANISAELQAGSRPESSRLQVKIKEAKRLSGEIFTDNNRSPSIGSFQRGLRINQANLLGLGDRLEISYANTNGSNEFNSSFTLPINPHNGTIQIKGGFSDSHVIEPPFTSLNITGHSRTYEFTYRQPILQKPTRELALGVTFSRLESETSLLNVGFPLEPGANNQGEVRVSAFRFFQDYVQRNPLQVFSARSQFSLGLDLFGATINSNTNNTNNIPDSRFFSWRGQAQYVRQLAPKTLLLLRSDLQLSNSSLLSLEQIGIGGNSSVQGYRQDLLLTDNGFSAAAEMRLPVLNLPEVPGVLQVTPFIDFGIGWNYSGEQPNSQSNKLLGTGLGLLWQMGDRLTARLDYGIPLIPVYSSERTWQEQGIYFTINYSPF